MKLRARIPLPAESIAAWVEVVPVRSVNPLAAGRLEVAGFPGWGLRLELFDAAGLSYAVIELDAEGGEPFPEVPP